MASERVADYRSWRTHQSKRHSDTALMSNKIDCDSHVYKSSR
jgi:hypothetical protein